MSLPSRIRPSEPPMRLEQLRNSPNPKSVSREPSTRVLQTFGSLRDLKDLTAFFGVLGDCSDRVLGIQS